LVGLWTSGQLVADNTQHSQNPCPSGIRTHSVSRRVATEPRLRSHDRWGRKFVSYRQSYLFL